MKSNLNDNHIYGNITLPQIVKFIIEIVGKDALLYFRFVDEATLNDAYKEKGSYEKYKANAQDKRLQFTYKDSIFGRIYQFFEKLESEFNINGYYKDFFMDNCVEQLLVQIGGMRPFEVKQSETPKKILFAQRGIAGDGKPFLCDPTFIDFVFLGSTSDFDALVREFVENSKTTFDDFYGKIARIAKSDEDSVKKALQRCRKMNIAPRWEIFYPLLQVVGESDDEEKTQADKLLLYYFYRNFREAIAHISVKKDLLLKFEELSKHYSESAYKVFYDKHLDVCKTGLHDLKKWFAYFDKLTEGNSVESVRKFQADFAWLRLELPHSIVFFQDWFCAKDYVFRYMENGKTDGLANAVKWYAVAFNDGKYFAGKNLGKFLLEGIAVGFYFEWKSNPKQMRDRILKASDISNADTKTPIPSGIKPLYDFAYAFDFVLNEKEDAFNYFYHCRDNFWNTFPPQTKNAEKIRGEDFLGEMGFRVFDKDIKSEIRKTLEKVTDKTVNTRLPTDHNVAYTPLSYAIDNCEWDFVRTFLDKAKFPSLDVNVPNTNNSYPICELLTKFKNPLLNIKAGRMTPPNLPKDGNIFCEILSHTNKRSLFTQTNHRKVSVLQEALETFQMKYIKPIVDKMTDDGKSTFPEDFRISADEVSPLYYAIQLKRMLKIPHDEYVKQLEMYDYNILWKNLAVP